jgi:flagellar biosynthesis/type III secretory pathway protein FliH
VRVHLHPDDITLLQSRLEPDQPLFSSTQEVQLVGDPAVGRGNCQAEAGDVTVMSNWYVQLENMRRQLLENIPHGLAGH